MAADYYGQPASAMEKEAEEIRLAAHQLKDFLEGGWRADNNERQKVAPSRTVLPLLPASYP